MIKSVYNEYFQKSRVFLYPALGISKGVSVTPIGTYTCWQDHIAHDDKKLCCVYHLRDDKEFKSFEKTKLFGNSLFDDFYYLENGSGMYIFNFSEFADDWSLYHEGKYSKLSKRLKSIILGHFAKSKTNYVYVDSYLNPEMYYDIYSNILQCSSDILKEVGELCDKPDLNKETIEINLKQLEISKINVI